MVKIQMLTVTNNHLAEKISSFSIAMKVKIWCRKREIPACHQSRLYFVFLPPSPHIFPIIIRGPLQSRRGYLKGYLGCPHYSLSISHFPRLQFPYFSASRPYPLNSVVVAYNYTPEDSILDLLAITVSSFQSSKMYTRMYTAYFLNYLARYNLARRFLALML